MGANNRYDRERTVTSQEADEARALHALGRLLHADAAAPIPDRAVAVQVAQVLHSTAIELDAGRPVPREVRRAVRGLANALRVALDPQNRP
jgi:hypothetical protein